MQREFWLSQMNLVREESAMVLPLGLICRCLVVIVLATALATSSRSLRAEELVHTCDRLQYDTEVYTTPRYHLRYRENETGDRTYFVWDSATRCSFMLLTPLDPETDSIWMFRIADLTVPLEYVRPAPVRIPRFLADREAEATIVRALFKDCRTSQSRKQCRELVSEKTLKDSAVLDLRRQTDQISVSIFRDQVFIIAND